METLLAITIGCLVAAAVYLMLARDMLRFLFGLTLISNAVNLAIFASGRITVGGVPPLVPDGEKYPVGDVANALPQALILTAIVIGFGLFAFSLVLAMRAYSALGTLDTDAMRLSEADDEKGDAA
ncbi:cation:proton antiporter [Meridianimarinicoccus roseus]|uniref:Cation:proton antiporter n=1 Tax=Meridianimarinicoccus roseus TaxID=2072018 RepID=A0A2V2LJT8_9RHOB|nr:Na+/H+ antiporter subunit C [Meridianimarinicoccus roseus]PWR04351.1 cation:proton antiporter [Meridianimarinicoccus roseus]